VAGDELTAGRGPGADVPEPEERPLYEPRVADSLPRLLGVARLAQRLVIPCHRTLLDGNCVPGGGKGRVIGDVQDIVTEPRPPSAGERVPSIPRVRTSRLAHRPPVLSW
jgi:hypothetical protein